MTHEEEMNFHAIGNRFMVRFILVLIFGLIYGVVRFVGWLVG